MLEAHAFSTIGMVMFWGAIACFILALVMAVLVGLGIWHARHTARETELLGAKAIPVS